MNRTIRFVVAVFGVIFATSGISHGFFETLQGNMPTNGVFIEAISETYQAWPSGGEAAFTLIPNFLVTGIAAIVVSFALIVWSVGFLHTRHGATVFLLLFILLVLVGGGIAQVLFFPVAGAFATRINKPLTGWRRILPEGIRGRLARVCPWSLAVFGVLFLFALTAAVVGYPTGINDANQLLGIIFAALIIGMAFFILSAVSAIARDIQRQDEPRSRATPGAQRTQPVPERLGHRV
ncbi:MAG: hypothetical protein K8I30_05155 [Anaerolineae bacterium]|nr:hypothetical protein [Anaerolineae bacterium]